MTILTGYDDQYAEIGDLFVEINRQYAQRYDCRFACIRNFDHGSHPSWQKLELIAKWLVDDDWVMWIDADAVIMNHDIDVREICDRRYALVVSQDWNPEDPSKFSMGVCLFQGNYRAFEILFRSMSFVEFENKPLWDQSAVQKMLRRHKDLSPDVKVLSRRALNAVPKFGSNDPAEPYQDGDLIAHFTGQPIGKLDSIRSFLKKNNITLGCGNGSCEPERAAVSGGDRGG